MIPRQILSKQPRHFGRGRSGQRLMTGILRWQKLAPAAADGIPSLQMLSRCRCWCHLVAAIVMSLLFLLVQLAAVNLSRPHWFICWFIGWMNVTNASGWLALVRNGSGSCCGWFLDGWSSSQRVPPRAAPLALGLLEFLHQLGHVIFHESRCHGHESRPTGCVEMATTPVLGWGSARQWDIPEANLEGIHL